MIQVVHWQEIVGDAFLSTFKDIARELLSEKRSNINNNIPTMTTTGNIIVCPLCYSTNIKKDRQYHTCNSCNKTFSDPIKNMDVYDQKRSMMLFCGFESEESGKGRVFYRTGWYGLPIIEGDEIKYRFISRLAYNPEPEFIGLRTFLDMKREQQEQNDEESYYNYGKVKSYIKQAVNDDFVKEEE